MIPPARPRWLDEAEPGRARRLAFALLAPLAWAWGTGAWIDRHARGERLRAPVRLPCRVVSVGSLVVGGSGKTPAAAWVAARLRARGHAVALASRGHGRRDRSRVLVVSDGRRLHATDPAETGDEPLVLASHAPGVPVLVGRDRAAAGQRAVAIFGADVLVLDDGFQHHRVARDVEIATFDGAGLGNGRLLPLGPLRERLAELRRADAILVVDGPLPDRDAESIRAAAPRATWFSARRRPSSLRRLSAGGEVAPTWLAGRRVGLLAGLARPDAFRRTLEALGAVIAAERSFADHHRYRPRDLRGLAADAPLWVTTEKDAVKILPSWAEEIDLRVLAIELEVAEAEAFLDGIERALAAKRGS